MGDGPCDLTLSLLSQLSAASEAHAHQAALLSAITVSGAHEEFRAALARCEGMQRLYEAAKRAIEAHRQNHGC